MTTVNVEPATPAVRKPHAISDRHLYRMGVVAGSVGAVVAFPFVALHPHLPPGDATGVLQTVLDFPAWLFLHFGLMMVLVTLIAALAAFSRSIQDDRASAWATFAFVVGLIGTVFAILGQGVDGLGLNVAAHVWQATPEDQKFAAVLTGAGVMGVATGIFILVLFFYFGLTSLVYSLAFGLSDEYPNWLAGIAFLGGSLGFSSALFTYFDDFSDPVYYGLFIPSAVVFLIWVFIASVILWRRELRVPKTGTKLAKSAKKAAKDRSKAGSKSSPPPIETSLEVREAAKSGRSGNSDPD
jgi:hypothetical protein